MQMDMKLSMALSILLVLASRYTKAQNGIEQLLNTYVYKVILTTIDGNTVSGQLGYLSDSEIQLLPGHLTKDDTVRTDQVIIFQFNQVKEVYMRRKKALLIGMVTGMGAGAFVGGILIAAGGPNQDYLTALEATGLLIATGGIIGTICGTFFGKHFRIEGDEVKFQKMYRRIHS